MALVHTTPSRMPWDVRDRQLIERPSCASASASDSSCSSSSTSVGRIHLDHDCKADVQPPSPAAQERTAFQAFALQLRQSNSHTAWQCLYMTAAARLQRGLQKEHPMESDIAMQAGQVSSMLQNLIHHRISEVRNGKVQQILSGSFLLESQQLLLWCGGLRPSDLISCARIAMAADGVRLAAEVDAQMTAVQNACLDHQGSICRGIQDASERLARLRVMARYVRSQGPKDAGPVDLVPKAQVLKDSIAQLTMQADELRLQCMDQLATLLTPWQLSYYLLAPMDMLQLED